MFTKLHVSVHEYGSKTKFGAKNEEFSKPVNVEFFLQLTAKLSNNLMKAAKVMSQVAFAGRYSL